MTDDHEQRLAEKLQRIEALYARAGTPGERQAAASARERILELLAAAARVEKPIEYKFSIRDPWSRKLLLALLRRYDIRPYRYPRQHASTIMARVPVSFVDETLWPEFQELNTTLYEYLSDVTDRVISGSLHSDRAEPEVMRQDELPFASH